MQPSTSDAQRALLQKLLYLTSKQEHALNVGDMTELSHLSELRWQAVRDGAAFLPPNTDWEPEVTDLVALVRHNSDCLQQSTRTCMAVVRRKLLQLTSGQQVTSYLNSATRSAGESWEG